MTAVPDGPRFRRSPVGATALTLLVLGLGAWGVINSPVFRTKRIEVQGVRHLTQADVVDAAGLPPGANLIRLSLDAVTADVERLPWVADAAASRDFPSTLVIRIVERTAVGWFRSEGAALVIARDGTVLERLDARPTGIPVLGEWAGGLGPGDRMPSPPITFRVVASRHLGLLGVIAGAGSVGDDVELELRGGGTILYGQPVGLGEKNRQLAALLPWARRHDLEIDSIDLRVPEAPTLDPVGTEVVSPSASP
jgi:cell division protein FtsQ